jgi:hypothetical protein
MIISSLCPIRRSKRNTHLKKTYKHFKISYIIINVHKIKHKHTCFCHVGIIKLFARAELLKLSKRYTLLPFAINAIRNTCTYNKMLHTRCYKNNSLFGLRFEFPKNITIVLSEANIHCAADRSIKYTLTRKPCALINAAIQVQVIKDCNLSKWVGNVHSHWLSQAEQDWWTADEGMEQW